MPYTKDPELTSMCVTGSYVHHCEDSCTDQAVANNLELDPIPDELQGLNVLERHVIAKFIPFAKIISLPKGQQRAVHGAVVCVPSEVEDTVQSLPRPPSESQILRNLDMRKVRTALLKLKDIHSEYREISLQEDADDDYLETTEFAPTENNDEDANNENEEQCLDGGSEAIEQPIEQEEGVGQQHASNQNEEQCLDGECEADEQPIEQDDAS
ncbi:unnamed protein product [Leuciscus chuanchicus]